MPIWKCFLLRHAQKMLSANGFNLSKGWWHETEEKKTEIMSQLSSILLRTSSQSVASIINGRECARYQLSGNNSWISRKCQMNDLLYHGNDKRSPSVLQNNFLNQLCFIFTEAGRTHNSPLQQLCFSLRLHLTTAHQTHRLAKHRLI